MEIPFENIDLDEQGFFDSTSFVTSGKISSNNPQTHGALLPGTQILVIKTLGVNALHEWTIAATTNHTHANVMNVIGYCIVPGTTVFYLLINFIDGVPLTIENIAVYEEHLRPAERVGQVINWCQQFISALEHIHERGCVVIGLSLRNLLLSNDNITVLFRRVCKVGDAFETDDHTLRYTAPEVWVNGASSSSDSDMYTFVCIVREIITSQAPHSGLNHREFKQTVIDFEPDLLDNGGQILSLYDDVTWPPAFPEELRLFFDPFFQGPNRTSLTVCKDYLNAFAKCTFRWSRFGNCLSQMDPRETLLEALHHFAKYEVPPSRGDLQCCQSEDSALRSVDTLTNFYDQLESLVREEFPRYGHEPQRISEVCAIWIYTNNTLMYRLINAVTAHASEDIMFKSEPVVPLFKRIYAAAQSLGEPYRGPASRLVHADHEPDTFDNYEAYFRVGMVLPCHQFTSYTKRSTPVITPTVRSIIFQCEELQGYDISKHSIDPSEEEILVLPPAIFTVTSVSPPRNGILKVVVQQSGYMIS